MESGSYSYENENRFEYLLEPEDLNYWRPANIPVIIVLVRLDQGDMYWKPVSTGDLKEPRRLRFDKSADLFVREAADRIASLCIDRNKLGSFVPPMLTGESAHVTAVRVLFPPKIFVGSSLYASGRDAARDLAKFNGHAPFDWVIRNRRFISFRDPRGGSLA